MPTRNVNLTDYYDQFVEELIMSGKYSNASEVMRAGLRLQEQFGEQARLQDEAFPVRAILDVAANAAPLESRGQAACGRRRRSAFPLRWTQTTTCRWVCQQRGVGRGCVAVLTIHS